MRKFPAEKVIGVIIVVILVLVVWFLMIPTWKECRVGGNSVIYCITVIG